MENMTHILQRAVDDLLARPSGPLAFRFVSQPLIAAALAARDGLHDAVTAQGPYLWTILTEPLERKDWLREGVAATARVLAIGFLIDAMYQWIELRAFYPGEAAIVAVGLGLLPYVVVRGPVARIARFIRGRRSAPRRQA